MTDNAEDDAQKNDVNISKLREMALRGDDYRSELEFSYYGLQGTLFVRPLPDPEFLPIAAFLEDRLDLDPDEAQDKLEEGRDDETNTIDPSQFDKEFVEIMHEAAVAGIDSEQGIAAGEDEKGLREIVQKLQGGKSLVIAQEVLEISSDAEKAEQFRRDGSGE